MIFELRDVRWIVNSVTLNARRIFLGMLVCCAAIKVGCRSDDDSSKALPDTRSMFKEVLTEFNVQREKVKQEFEEGNNTLLTFKEAIKTAQNKDAEFAKVYTKWKRVEGEVKSLHEKFSNLVKGADSLYAELNEKANSITDGQLKTKTLKPLMESKEKYTIRLKRSRNNIELLDKANIKVRDTITALEINYTLEVLEEKLTQTFQDIDVMIESVMKDLEDLSRESELLLTIRFG